MAEEGVKPDLAKVQTLIYWEFPTNALGVMQFLGLANYFRKFIPDFSRIAAPLTELKKETVQFQKGEEKMRALRAAALCLCKRAGRWPTTQPSSAALSAITPLCRPGVMCKRTGFTPSEGAW